MRPQERDAILRTGVRPLGGRDQDLADFSRSTGISDPASWALNELKQAVADQNADDTELAMIVGFQSGMDVQWVEPLIDVLESDWSHSHEDAAFQLGELGDPRAVIALVRAAHWVPAYLDFDESRSLAVKAIHSLGRIPGPAALTGLEELLHHEDRPLRTTVERVLNRRLREDDGSSG